MDELETPSAEDSSPDVFIPKQKPRTNGAMILFLLVAMGGGAMYFMHLRTGPATAAAAPPEAVSAQKTIDTFLSEGGTQIRAMRDTLKNTQTIVKEFSEFPNKTQVPLSDLKTNPFRSADYKPAQTQEVDHSKDEAIAAARSLQLQSIITGAHPACMMNGSLYVQGQTVNGCTIESIKSNRVIVRHGNYRFELKMQEKK